MRMKRKKREGKCATRENIPNRDYGTTMRELYTTQEDTRGKHM